MTARHIMDKQSRRKKVYVDKHRQLRSEIEQSRKPELSKSQRKRMASEAFRATGE